VNDHTASLSTIQSSVDGVKLEFGVIGTIDGTTGGFLMTGVRQLDGSASWTMEISGSLVVDKSITANKLTVNSLSAVTANMGTLTAGLIRSPSGNFIIDATNERIEIWS
jgi:hypothetical protein